MIESENFDVPTYSWIWLGPAECGPFAKFDRYGGAHAFGF